MPIAKDDIEAPLFAVIVPLSTFVCQRTVAMDRPITGQNFIVGSGDGRGLYWRAICPPTKCKNIFFSEAVFAQLCQITVAISFPKRAGDAIQIIAFVSGTRENLHIGNAGIQRAIGWSVSI